VDFVIAGLALGSLLLLLGVAARDYGPRLLSKPAPSTSLSTDPSAAAAPRVELWRKLTPLAGPTIMFGGAVVILATLAGIFLQMSDSAGSRLVLISFLVAVIALAIRLPFLARARPKVASPKLARRRPATTRERTQPARAPRPAPHRAAHVQPAKRRPSPAPNISYQPRQNGAQNEAPELAGSAAIPPLPDIFSSDEPIQTGLLEKLLAEEDGRSQLSSHDGQDDRPRSNNESSGFNHAPRQSGSDRSAR
jgi:hypothetical protein